MSEERRKIIEMVADGKISVEDAERLLEKLSDSPEVKEQPQEERIGPDVGPPRTPKYLRVVVNSADKDQVNIRVPLALVRTGIKLTTMLPSDANEKLKDKGIDLSQLSQLDSDELLQALRELKVDVDSNDGDTVRVFCE
jgi:hypothetical protein